MGCQDASTHLHPKNVFSVVAFEESPLRGLALQQVGAHSHLPTGDISSKALADPSEREVPTLGKGKGSTERLCQELCFLPKAATANRGQKGEAELPTVVRGAK